MPAAEDAAVSQAEARQLFGVLSEHPTLILAVSGGPDSTALLWLAARWRKALKHGPKLVAVTIDHGLRRESKREAAAVKRLARSLGVEHRTLRWAGRKPRTGLQEAARNARYRLLSEAAHKAGAWHVLTAHTLDDQAETVLFRMARGSGVRGLAGMGLSGNLPVPEGKGLWLVRPLLDVPKSRLLATLKAAKVAYADDPTNRDPRFTRPRLRALMPALAREGLTAARLGLLARRMEQAEVALDTAVDDAQSRISRTPWPAEGPVAIDAGLWFDLSQETATRLLARAIELLGDEGPVELGKLETLVMALYVARARSQGLRRTLAGAMITLDGDVLTVERAPPRSTKRAPKRP